VQRKIGDINIFLFNIVGKDKEIVCDSQGHMSKTKIHGQAKTIILQNFQLDPH
jgi:hypothetical protein